MIKIIITQESRGLIFLVLSLLHMQAKVFHIPLNYLSLHTIDPEAAAESAEDEF